VVSAAAAYTSETPYYYSFSIRANATIVRAFYCPASITCTRHLILLLMMMMMTAAADESATTSSSPSSAATTTIRMVLCVVAFYMLLLLRTAAAVENDAYIHIVVVALRYHLLLYCIYCIAAD